MLDVFLSDPTYLNALHLIRQSVAQGVSPREIMDYILVSPEVHTQGYQLTVDNFQNFPDVMDRNRVVEFCNKIMDFLTSRNGSAEVTDIHDHINHDKDLYINVARRSTKLSNVCINLLVKNQYIWKKYVDGKHVYTIVNRTDFLVLCKHIQQKFDDYINGGLHPADRELMIDLIDIWLHFVYDNEKMTKEEAKQICEDEFDNRKMIFNNKAITMCHLLRDFLKSCNVSTDPIIKTDVLKLANL